MRINKLEYEYLTLERCIKQIRAYHFQEQELISELHEKLIKGLDKAPGKDIHPLNNELAGLSRIKVGKRNEFRLVYSIKKLKDNKTQVKLIQFGVKDDTKKTSSFYSTLIAWYEKYKKNPDNYNFIPIKQFQYRDSKELLRFIKEDHKYSIDFNNDQKKLLNNYHKNNNVITCITGIPGSGKTVLGAEISKRCLDKNEEATVLIVIPNVRLVSFYKRYLLANEIAEENIIEIVDYLHFRNGAIYITTFKNLIKLIEGKINYEPIQDESKIIQLLKESKYWGAIKSSFNDEKEVLDFYNAFFDENEELINYPDKDAFSPIYSDKFEKLGQYTKKYSQLFKDNGIATRKGIAYSFLKNLLSNKDNTLYSFTAAGNQLTIIVDEVQDLIGAEWRALVDFCAEQINKKNGIKLIFLGDEKQRVTVSGFSWTNLSKYVYSININRDFTGPKKLSKNHRVTQQVADFIAFIDSITNERGTRRVVSIKKTDCIFSKERVNVLCADLRNLERAIGRIVKESTQNYILNKEAKAIVITEEYTNNIKNLNNEMIEIVNLYDSKGTEYESVFLLNPFRNILPSKELDVEQNYKLYTMCTRSRNSLTILLDTDEYEWFEAILKNSQIENSIILHPKEGDSVTVLEQIIDNVGLEEITEENYFVVLMNRLSKVIKTLNPNSKIFYDEVNDLIIRGYLYPSKLEDIIRDLNDNLRRIDINFDQLNNSISGFDDEKKSVLLFVWFVFNREFITARYLAYQNNLASDLIEYVENLINSGISNKSKILLKYLNDLESKKTIRFENYYEEKYCEFFIKHLFIYPENMIDYHHLKNIINEIKTLMKGKK